MIKSTYIEFFKNNSIQYNRISILPDVFPSDCADDAFKKYLCLELLTLFANRKHDEKLEFSRKSNIYIDISQVPVKFGKNYKEICKIIEFAYSEEKSSYEKIIIIKKILEDSFDKGIDINNLDSAFWEFILEEVDLEYNLYVNDEVSKFLKEKKEIIKEQFNLSNQINSQISTVKKSLISNVVYIIGIFLSKFVIDGLNKGSINYAPFAIYIAFVFSFFLLITFIFSGESKSHEKFEEKIKIINKYYPKLYLTKDNIIKDLEKNITNPEITELKKIERTCRFIYIGSTIIFFHGLLLYYVLKSFHSFQLFWLF